MEINRYSLDGWWWCTKMSIASSFSLWVDVIIWGATPKIAKQQFDYQVQSGCKLQKTSISIGLNTNEGMVSANKNSQGA